MPNKTIVATFLPDFGKFTLCLSVSGEQPYSSEDWAEYMAGLRKVAHQPVRTIVVSLGGSPDATQRAQMADLFKGKSVPTAVVTPNTWVRAVTKGLSVLNPGIKAFSPDDMKGAFRFIDIPAAQEGRVLDEISRLRAQVQSGRR